MPVLGTVSANPIRRAAYPSPSGRNNWGNVVGLILAVLLIRNLLFHDYRTDEIQQLTKSGKSMEEIRARYIPPTRGEKRETARQSITTMTQLLSDVATLKEDVSQLKQQTTNRLESLSSATISSIAGSTMGGADQEGGKSLDTIRFEEEEGSAAESMETRGLRGGAEVTLLKKFDTPPLSSNRNEEVEQKSHEQVKITAQQMEDKGSVPEGDLLGRA